MTRDRRQHRVEAEKPIFRSPTRSLRNFVENSPVATFLVEADGRLVYANRAVTALLGYSGEELLGSDFATMVCPEDLAMARGQTEALLSRNPSSFQSERRYLTKDGRTIWVLASVALLPNQPGGSCYISVQAISIDAQKQAEAALIESERRWSFALESAGQGVWEADIVKGVVYYSPKWRSMRGFAPDEVVDSSEASWLARVHPEDRDRIQDMIHRQNLGELTRNAFEYRERHKDGHYIWISSRGAPDAWAADGTPTRVIGTDTDITQSKRAQEAMQTLSHRLELALDASQIGVFETNLETGELFLDDRVHAIFGLARKPGPILAPDWDRVILPDDAPATLQAFADATASRGTFRANFRIRRPDGEIRYVASHAKYFDGDQAPKMVGTNRDVTDEVTLTQGLKAAKLLAEARNAELETAKALIEKQALHDALTGLPNRRYLDRILDDCYHGGREATAGTLGLLHIDLDRFKQINDTLGHVAGDAMLVHVARLLCEDAGPNSFVARVGGDEFVVACLHMIDTAQLSDLAERLIARLRQPVPYDGHLCRFGASIGIAVDVGLLLSPGQILMNGDLALYRAKSQGKNRFAFFTQCLQDEIESTKRLADDILRGIEHDEFIPHYQPLVDAVTHEVTGVEALVRWNHPVEGMLSPSRFLRVAEDLDVLSTIDAAILTRAVADLRSWRAAGLRVPSISVNVSLRRLGDKHLLPSLQRLNIEPGTVSFEFLESIFLDEVDHAVAANIEAIRALGIGIDVDDFGTGHTSFVSLLKLNPDRFKIDRQLIAPIATSPSQRRLIASFIEIGNTLGIRVVAEGVETMEQAAILQKLGCDTLQGYAFARPMSAAALVAWLREKDSRTGHPG